MRVFGFASGAAKEFESRSGLVKNEVEVKKLTYGGGADLLLDFELGGGAYFGLFGGASYSAAQVHQSVESKDYSAREAGGKKQKSKRKLAPEKFAGLTYQGGVALTIANAHRIEVAYQSAPRLESPKNAGFSMKDRGSISVGYQFTF